MVKLPHFCQNATERPKLEGGMEGITKTNSGLTFKSLEKGVCHVAEPSEFGA